MASERVVGRVLAERIAAGELQRDEVVVCTKGGYIPDDGAPPADREADLHAHFVATGLARPDEIVESSHCLAPDFLSHQIRTSLANLGLAHIDVYYLHNPETQLGHVGPGEFLDRLRRAFARLEEEVAAGRIGYYGIATWQGLRAGEQERHYLPLFKLAQLAQEVGGPQHRFRFIQFPYNLGMPEAFLTRNQYVTRNGDAELVAAPLLAAAVQLGITAMASAALRQTQIFGKIPASVKQVLEPLANDAQIALQFVRSTPGITTALVGMRQVAHVEENLALAAVDPLSQTEFLKRFTRRR
jgi:aryl-alcohol dehydrogenase-like predicted oxidoreductase